MEAEVRDRPADRRRDGGAQREAGLGGYIDGGFGRAVEIVQLAAQHREETILELARERLAAAQDSPQARPLSRGERLQKGGQHRGDEVHRRHPLPGDEPRQIRGVPVTSRLGEHQTRSGEQRPEEFPDRHVEAEGRLLQNAILRRESVAGLHPEQAVADRVVGIHRSLGLARRARGVDGIGQGGGVELHAEISVRPGGKSFAARADLHEVDPGSSQTSAGAGVRDYDPDIRLREYRGESLARHLGVEGDVGRTGLQCAEEGDHQLQRPLQANAHDALRSHVELPQGARQPVRSPVQLAVRQGPSIRDRGDGQRTPGDLGFDQPVQQEAPETAEASVVPFPKDLLVLRLTPEGYLTERDLRVGHHGREETLEMAGEPRDGGPVEQVGAVFENAAEPSRSVRLQSQGKVELGGHLGQHDPGQNDVRRWDFPGGVLKDEKNLEKGRLRDVAFELQLRHQLLERQILVRVGVEHGIFHLSEGLPEGEVSRAAGTHDQSIYEEPDQRLELELLALRHRHANGEIVLASVPGEQSPEGR